MRVKNWVAGKLLRVALFWLMDQETRREVIWLLNEGVGQGIV